MGLPLEVHMYHSLYPLSDNGQCRTYKSVCSVDGCTYTLLRIPDFRLINELAMTAVESWSRIRHCNIVSIREAFTTRAFGDSCKSSREKAKKMNAKVKQHWYLYTIIIHVQ